MNLNYVVIGVIALIAYFVLANQGGVRVLQSGDDNNQLRATALEALIRDRELKQERELAKEEREFQKELLRIQNEALIRQKELEAERIKNQEERYYEQQKQEREAELKMQERYYASQERMGFLSLIGSAVGAVFTFLLSDAEYYNHYAKRYFDYKAGELGLMSASHYRGKV